MRKKSQLIAGLDLGARQFTAAVGGMPPQGRLLVRAICMLFDRYLRESKQRARYSKVI